MYKSLTLSILLFISICSFGQNFRLGFQASPQMTWMNSSKTLIANNEIKPGIKYGLEADIYLAGFPRYLFNTGLFVSNHSFSAHYDIGEKFYINQTTFDKPVNITYKVNYIEIPMDIKLKSDQFYRMTFYGQFGLTHMFNLSASATSSNSQFTGDNINQDFSNRTIKPYNLSMLMGGGVEYDVAGNTSINLGIQYSNGLIDITDIKALEEKTVFNALRLVLGVMF